MLSVCLRCSYPEFSLQGVLECQRVSHLVFDELREVRAQHSVSAVLPAASRIPRHPRHSVERGQLRVGEGEFSW